MNIIPEYGHNICKLIHIVYCWWPPEKPKVPVIKKTFPCHDVIMYFHWFAGIAYKIPVAQNIPTDRWISLPFLYLVASSRHRRKPFTIKVPLKSFFFNVRNSVKINTIKIISYHENAQNISNATKHYCSVIYNNLQYYLIRTLLNSLLNPNHVKNTFRETDRSLIGSEFLL